MLLDDLSGRPSSDDEDRDPHKVHFNPPVFTLWKGRFVIRLSFIRYVTFTIIGISLLWPWNAFLSASAYYGERFANSPKLVKVYSSTMMSVSTVTSTLYNYYLSQSQTGVSYNHRLNLGLGITIAIFVIMAILSISETFISMGDESFFTMLMLMVFVSSLATCLAQNGTMAIVNVLGGVFANGVMVGQAIAGVLPSIALILSILLVEHANLKKGDGDDDPQYQPVEKNYGVFIYYITASIIATISMLLFYCINYFELETNYSALHINDDDTEAVAASNLYMETEIEDGAEEEIVQKAHVPFGLLWSKLKLIVMTIFFTFSITLIFPVFASTVTSIHKDESKHVFFQNSIYIPFIYLIWNLGDLTGRILCGYRFFIITNPRLLIFYSLCRILFVPLFLTCNINGNGAVMKSDFWYIFLQLVFGVSNGQLCTSSFMIIRDYCDTDDEKEAAGGFSTVFLSVGLAVGSLFSYLLVAAIS